MPFFRVETEGSVTAMRMVHDDETVDFVPDDGPALWRAAEWPRWEKPGRG